MAISIDSFRGSWFKSFRRGRDAWVDLTKMYEWSKDENRLAALKVEWPEYSLAWARTQIMRIFNLDPDFLPFIAARFGGGNTPEQIKTGLKMISDFGIAESSRAVTIITQRKWASVADRIAKANGPDALRAITDEVFEKNRAELRAAGRRLREERGKKVPRSGRNRSVLLRENELLRKENAKLKARVAELEARIVKM